MFYAYQILMTSAANLSKNYTDLFFRVHIQKGILRYKMKIFWPKNRSKNIQNKESAVSLSVNWADPGFGYLGSKNGRIWIGSTEDDVTCLC